MRTEESLISKKDSTLTKGILILLIVLGHNSMIMEDLTINNYKFIFHYLYSFHVYLFLILPFLYNTPQFNLERLKKNFISIYKPYTIMFAALFFTNIILLKEDFHPMQTFYAYITGNEKLLREAIGASFPWFMPTMFSLILLRNILFNKKYKTALIITTIISAVLFVIFRILLLKSTYTVAFIAGSVVAIVYFSLAVTTRWIYENLRNKKHFNTISVIIFIITSIIFFVFLQNKSVLYNFSRRCLLPISALFTIFTILKYIKADTNIYKIFSYCGQESLPIYMIHIFVYNILYQLAKKANIDIGVISGIITYILTIGITILIIQLCKRINIYKFIFKS